MDRTGRTGQTGQTGRTDRTDRIDKGAGELIKRRAKEGIRAREDTTHPLTE